MSVKHLIIGFSSIGSVRPKKQIARNMKLEKIRSIYGVLFPSFPAPDGDRNSTKILIETPAGSDNIKKN